MYNVKAYDAAIGGLACPLATVLYAALASAEMAIVSHVIDQQLLNI